MVRRFATVWPNADAPADAGKPAWPDSSGRQEAEATWRVLDAQEPAPDPPPVPPSPPGRSALGAFDPGRRGIRVLVVVAVLVGLAAGYLAWRSRPRAEPVPAAPAVATAPVPSTGQIIVAVQGRVAHPGLYRLPPGARVADALAAAGGALPGVDLSYVNLARKVSDGELILVGTSPPPEPGGPGSGGKVNLNSASLAQLDTLPGVGPALAQRILDYRAQHGDFHSVDELRRVAGIGDAKFAQLKDLVTV